MQVCLPVCGFVSGNRARPREMADSRVLATARHIHICLRVAVLHNSPPPASVRSAGDPDRDRAWHLWSSSSRNVVPRPRSRSPRRLSRRLHGVTRRHASSAGYRLLALRRVPPRIRRTEPSRIAQLATRHVVPLPHYMLNPFKRPKQPLIGSPQAGNSAANQTRKHAFYNGSAGPVPRLFHLSFCLYQSFTDI